jgi:membrane-associated protease RseP (regulator of RpoE activity)
MIKAAFSWLSIVGACCLAAWAQQPGLPALERLEQQVQSATPVPARPGYLGLIADDRQDQGRAIRIMEVTSGGPAAQAGLQVGDLVVAINGQPMRSMADMERVMLASPSGSELRFEVERGNERRELRVVLTERKPGDPFGRIPGELPEPTPNPVALRPSPVEPPNALPAPRIEQLERRIEQLEKRVQELERALQRPAPGTK